MVFYLTQFLLLPIGQDVVMLLCLFHANNADVMTGCQNLPRAQV